MVASITIAGSSSPCDPGVPDGELDGARASPPVLSPQPSLVSIALALQSAKVAPRRPYVRKPSPIEVCGEVCRIDLGKRYVAIADAADHDLLAGWLWKPVLNRPGIDPVYAERVRGRVRFRMHREILGAVTHQLVDHINGDTLDNRRANLRVCTFTENSRNRRISRNNKSGYKGVVWYKTCWRANIKVDRKNVYLGQFATAEDAARAYDRAAVELHGDFASVNFAEELR